MALNSKMNWKGPEIGLGLTELIFQHFPGGKTTEPLWDDGVMIET
jgi:hypothetical protein